jgi:hypothetical protein
MRDGIDKLAGHFHASGEFDSVFIGSLVPWNDLVGEPNAGHAAVSDLLISRAADAGAYGVLQTRHVRSMFAFGRYRTMQLH